MPYTVDIDEARQLLPGFEFVKALTESEQKAAFHVRKDGSDFCLKLISPRYGTDRLTREIEAMIKLDHPNVVKLVEYRLSATALRSEHYIVEEFVAGHDLSEDLKTNTPWELAEILRVFSHLFDGLEALREGHLVHRDLKPSNIRIRASGEPVIIDFGLARHLDKESLTQTFEGARIGTPVYFSPEQFSGTKRDIDHRTDLYAAGILLYQAVTGQHPWYTTQIKTMDELSEAALTPIHALPDAVEATVPKSLGLIVKRLLEVDRSRRPPTAGMVAAQLRRIGEF